jgi:ABC-2 type transport system permease protein
MSVVVRRYLRLFRTQVRISVTMAMQYRTEFLLKGAMQAFWVAVTLVPLLVVFGQREKVVGWSYPEALVVLAWFSLLKGVLEGGVTPSLTAVVEGVRTGALDYVLLKPADAQFLVSTARFEPWRVVDFVGAAAIFFYAFGKLGRWPRASELMVAAVLLVMAVLLLYSIWILVISASFWVVRVDNLSYLFGSLFDAGRWPISVFRGTLRKIFTYVFPLALLTTIPAEALLGKLSTRNALLALAGGAAFAIVARLVWLRALRSYTSASS